MNIQKTGCPVRGGSAISNIQNTENIKKKTESGNRKQKTRNRQQNGCPVRGGSAFSRKQKTENGIRKWSPKTKTQKTETKKQTTK